MINLQVAPRAGGGPDVVREALALVLQALIDAEATEMIGAGRHERTEARTGYRTHSGPAAVDEGRRRGAQDSKLREV